MSVPSPRQVELDFESTPVPVDWLAGALLPSVVLSAFSAVFPPFERSMAREVRRVTGEAPDSLDIDRVALRAFGAQEAQHSRMHDRSLAAIREQGFDVDRVHRASQALCATLLDRLAPASLRLIRHERVMLASYAGAEHWTAELAEVFLHAVLRLLADADDVGAEIDNTLCRLYLWHAYEEIEHETAVIDLFRAVGGTERERRYGFVTATLCLVLIGTWSIGVLCRDLPSIVGPDEWRARGGWPRLVRQYTRPTVTALGRGIRSYWRRGFHPSDAHRAALLPVIADLLPDDELVKGPSWKVAS